MEELEERIKALAQDFNKCKKSFVALGDENRQLILIALMENPRGLRVGELAQKVNLSRPAVSHHLKLLKDVDMVSMYKKGTMNFYHVDADESQWNKICSLTTQVNSLVQEVSLLRKQGQNYYPNKD